MMPLKFELFRADGTSDVWTAEPPINVGRQDPSCGEPAMGLFDRNPCGPRLIVAAAINRDVPRYFFSVSAADDSQIRIHNLHPQCELLPTTGDAVHCKGSRSFGGAVELMIRERTTLRISTGRPTSDSSNLYRTLNSQPLDPMTISMQVGDDLATHAPDTGQGQEIVHLLQQVLPVIRESVTTDSFFRAAAFAAVRIAKLNRCIVRLFEGDQFEDRAEVFEDSTADESTSRLRRSAPDVSDTMIDRVRKRGLTQIFDTASPGALEGASLANLSQAVAAPILDKERRVVGVLYGDRWTDLSMRPFSDIEAKLVEILAGAVSAGMARQSEERQRTSMQVYFSDRVAKHIVVDESLLDAKETDVSVMFCDVRKFSSISKSLGPKGTVSFMQDVFTVLSECVERTDGVLINYIGDELIAMWGAPDSQPDHAYRSLTTAVSMFAGIEEIRTRWADKVCEPIRVGIGVNSGTAAVGNTGSRIKFQYGVFGNVVNVASRLQSATKQFGVDCLVSSNTLAKTDNSFHTRNLATISVVGIPEDIVVHQLVTESSERWQRLSSLYEAALEDYHAMRFADAIQTLGQVLRDNPGDEPSMRLLGLSVEQMRHPSENFSPVDSLTQK
ncbi:Adenylate cyclase 1 [Rosistilla oblonga]|uniref:adenylate/guanylate cyclase domain-containing protein n=1 Tax=Rosistilla oblonga TaxID=2527990 RepID=UPI00118A27B3|nr:adenylate/guanylate cyclase domain-containing protein [Rosistilla oblonga]QDV13046.1 Adenylate cyclase 1 [Rosistilla oblonga]